MLLYNVQDNRQGSLSTCTRCGAGTAKAQLSAVRSNKQSRSNEGGRSWEARRGYRPVAFFEITEMEGTLGFALKRI